MPEILTRKQLNLRGRVFERLTVIEIIKENGYMKCLCVCSCGKKKTVLASHLLSKRTRSCGCLKKELSRKNGKNKGLSTDSNGKRTRLYKIWCGIKRRCNNPNDISFSRYGGKGIKMCLEWSNNYLSFYNWAMENGYKEVLTIDRKNNKGNYSPDNCRWATVEEQARNKSNNKYLIYQGKSMTISEWARKLGVSEFTLRTRVKLGWDTERILTQPVRHSGGDKKLCS